MLAYAGEASLLGVRAAPRPPSAAQALFAGDMMSNPRSAVTKVLSRPLSSVMET